MKGPVHQALTTNDKLEGSDGFLRKYLTLYQETSNIVNKYEYPSLRGMSKYAVMHSRRKAPVFWYILSGLYLSIISIARNYSILIKVKKIQKPWFLNKEQSILLKSMHLSGIKKTLKRTFGNYRYFS